MMGIPDNSSQQQQSQQKSLEKSPVNLDFHNYGIWKFTIGDFRKKRRNYENKLDFRFFFAILHDRS